MKDRSKPPAGRSLWLTGMAWLFGGNMLATVITTVVGIFIARLLGPADFGLYSLVVVGVGLVATVTTFRLDMHLVTEFGRRVGDEFGEVLTDRDLYARALRASYLLTIPTCLLGAVLVIGFAPSFLRVPGLIGLAEVFISPWLLARALLQVRMLQSSQVLAATVGRLAWAASIAAVAWADPQGPLVWILLARLLGVAVEGAALSVAAKLPLPGPGFLRRGIAEEIAILRAAFPLLLSGVAGTLYNRTDQPLIALLRGRVETGFYGAAVRLAEIPHVIPGLVQNVSQPQMVKSYRDRDMGAFASSIADSLLFMLIPAGLAIAVLFSVGDKLGIMLFGEAYRGLAPLIRPLALAEIGVSIGATFASAALASNRRRLMLHATVAGLVVNVGANLLLIPRLGAAGAAWASMIAYSTAGLVLALKDAELRRAGSAAWSVAVRASAAIAVASFVMAFMERDLTIALPVGTLVYVVAVAALFPTEVARLVRWLTKRHPI